MSDWISVEDSLPISGQRVLAKYTAVYDRRLCTFWYDDGGNAHFVEIHEGDGKGSQPATHWQPLS